MQGPHRQPLAWHVEKSCVRLGCLKAWISLLDILAQHRDASLERCHLNVLPNLNQVYETNHSTSAACPRIPATMIQVDHPPEQGLFARRAPYVEVVDVETFAGRDTVVPMPWEWNAEDLAQRKQHRPPAEHPRSSSLRALAE